MTRPLYINGRFRVQSLSGVQRFANEITAAISRQWSDQDGPRPIILQPGGPVSIPDATLGLHSRIVGKRNGQIWEQAELPKAARGGLLLNLGNTAPIIAKNQIVVLHDAGVFGAPEAYSWKFRAWYKGLHTLLARTGAHIVTVSEFSKSELARYLPIPANRIKVIPEGADHILATSPADDILSRHTLTPGRYVLAVGNLAAHKNLASLRILAQKLDQRGIPLVISGGINTAVFGTTNTTLPSPARYVGRVTDGELLSLYRNAACFVFPSKYEGYGLPPVEAMAAGCPVVAASIPPLEEVCGNAAHYADPENPELIAQTVLNIVENPALQDEMRTRGLTHTHNMTWDQAALKLLAIVRKLTHDAA